jgi:hypothetical protein
MGEQFPLHGMQHTAQATWQKVLSRSMTPLVIVLE